MNAAVDVVIFINPLSAALPVATDADKSGSKSTSSKDTEPDMNSSASTFDAAIAIGDDIYNFQQGRETMINYLSELFNPLTAKQNVAIPSKQTNICIFLQKI